MEIQIFEDYPGLSAAAAAMIVDYVRNKPNALLCFASGDTPKLTYQLVSRQAKNDNVDFSRSFLIGLDEWLGIPPGNTGSCHYFLQEYLFKSLPVQSSQVHLFDAMNRNVDEEICKMNSLIEAREGIDLMVVGVGMNGHIGFNEPGTDINTMAHVAVLDDTTKTVGQKYFNEKVAVAKGITVGLQQVMQAETVLMIANGKKKAPVIKKALEDEISTSFPASLMRSHKNGIIMIDREAASELQTIA